MTATSPRAIARSMAMGILLSLLFFYSIHVLGAWESENYRPDPDTTATVLLHNKCALLGHTHTLRPNTGIPVMDAGINGTKLAGSFMNFTDGHITGIIIAAVLAGGLIVVARKTIIASAT